MPTFVPFLPTILDFPRSRATGHDSCSIEGTFPATASDAVGDGVLLARIRKGDHDAFAELVRRHERWARTLAGRILGDFDEAEDVAQDVFLKVWTTPPKARPNGSIRAWMTTALTRRCIDHMRRARPSALAEDFDPPDQAPCVRERLDEEIESRLLAGLIERLPARQRMALLLFHGEGLPVRTAAEAMELSPKAFESLLQRARSRVKSMWRSEQ